MADTVAFDLRGVQEFQRNIKQLATGRKPGVKLRRAVRKAMRKAKRPVQKAARREAPKFSGVLRKAITSKVGQSGDTIWAIIGVRQGPFMGRLRKQKIELDAFYSHMVEGGTKPHPIPRLRKRETSRSKFMVFEVGGQVVTTSKVRHPGTRAQPFLQKAGRAGFTRAKRVFAVEFRRELRKEVEV